MLQSGQLDASLRDALLFQLFLALYLADMRLRIMQNFVVSVLLNLVTALIPALLAFVVLQLLVFVRVIIAADARSLALGGGSLL